MEEVQATRSLGATLVSAVCTFAVFLAANWEMAMFVDFLANFMERGISRVLFISAIPSFPILFNVNAVYTVWLLKKELSKKGVKLCKGWKSVSIMASCPIFIQIPPHRTWEPIEGVGVDDWDKADSYVQGFCPLELPPRPPGVSPRPPRADPRLPPPPPRRDHFYSSHSLSLGALPRRPTPSPAAQETNPQATAQQQPCNDEKKYLQIDVAYHGAREVLLELGFAPEYKQLRFLRSSSTFQTVVIAVQALGYILGVVVRKVKDLAISPLEAIIAYLCVFVVMQLLMEFYACTHFKRPLLLRLNPDQFSDFYEELVERHSANVSNMGSAPADDHLHKKSPSSRRAIVVSYILYNCVMTAFLGFVLSDRAHCLFCGVSTFLFFGAPLVYLVLHGLTMVAECIVGAIIAPRQIISERYKVIKLYGVRFIAALVSATGMVLAVVATCRDWSIFDTATNNYNDVLAWIVPHV